MKITRAKSENKNSYFKAIIQDDFEYENPYPRFIRETHQHLMSGDIDENIGGLTFEEHASLIQINKIKTLNHLKDILETELPKGLEEVLKNPQKKEQDRLLKDVELNYYALQKWIFYAWDHYGYTYSKYRIEHKNKGDESLQYPEMIFYDGTRFEKIGKTNMSEGQMKHAVRFRNVVIAHFLDNKDGWHCLFTTYYSLAGKENGGIPHMHYISSQYGRTREYVLKKLSSKNYKLPRMPHIPIHRD